MKQTKQKKRIKNTLAAQIEDSVSLHVGWKYKETNGERYKGP